MDYIVFLHGSGRKASTCCGHLAAIRHLHIINGLPDPTRDTPRLALVKRGIAVRTTPEVRRAPLTADSLLAFMGVLDLSVFDDSLLFAAAALGFFGFLRVSEFLAPGPKSDSKTLTLADISWFYDRIDILLRSSKGDRLRRGVTVSVGRTFSQLCPLSALIGYLYHRSRVPTPLDLATSPLFVFRDGRHVSKQWFSDRLARVAKSIGVQGEVKPHSLRIGAATSAWRAGFSDSQIQAMGRWKSTAFMRYIRPAPSDLARLNAQLAQPDS
jgi:hypothetical protein